jgi:hypothetical protein
MYVSLELNAAQQFLVVPTGNGLTYAIRASKARMYKVKSNRHQSARPKTVMHHVALSKHHSSSLSCAPDCLVLQRRFLSPLNKVTAQTVMCGYAAI